MHRLYRWLAPGVAAGLLAGLAGCSNNPAPPPPGASGKATNHNATSGQQQHAAVTPAAAPVPVKAVTWDGYQDTVKGFKGKVVVADFWTLT